MEKRAMKHKSYKAILTILDPEENTMDEKEYELDIKGDGREVSGYVERIDEGLHHHCTRGATK